MTEQQKDYQRRLALVTAMSNIESKEKVIKSSEGYFKAYLWSILIPPIGIFYFIKFIFFTEEKKGNVKAGIISFALTIVSFLLSVWLTAELLKKTTSVFPSQNLQIIQNLALPDNQKRLLDLLK